MRLDLGLNVTPGESGHAEHDRPSCLSPILYAAPLRLSCIITRVVLPCVRVSALCAMRGVVCSCRSGELRGDPFATAIVILHDIQCELVSPLRPTSTLRPTSLRVRRQPNTCGEWKAQSVRDSSDLTHSPRHARPRGRADARRPRARPRPGATVSSVECVVCPPLSSVLYHRTPTV